MAGGIIRCGRVYIAGVVKLVDAGDSKSPDGNIMSVRVRPPAYFYRRNSLQAIKSIYMTTVDVAVYLITYISNAADWLCGARSQSWAAI